MGKTISTKIFSNKSSYLLPAFLSGIIMIAAYPPLEQGYLAWIALLPLLGTCLKVSPPRAFWAGFIFGLPINLYLNLYLANVLFPYLPTPLDLTAMVCLVIFISLFYGLFSLSANLACRLGKAWFTALAVPSLWLLMEYSRSLGFMAYNVGYLGYSQWGYPALLNIAAVFGYWGLPFLIVFFQTILLLLYRKDLTGFKLYTVSALFFFLLGTGLILPAFQKPDNDNRQLWVTLIQGNSDSEEMVEKGKTEIMQHYLALTRQALEAAPATDLVVWPETVVDLDFRTTQNHIPAMVQAAEDHGVDLLYGARVRDRGHLFNSIALITKEQERIPLYHKQRLVPFVEYFPMEELLNRLLKLELLLGSYTAGDEITIFKIDDIPLAGVICFESYFGDHTRLFAAVGSRHLFVLTNDAWFGESIGLEQHAQAAAIRAAEMGRGVTQVANSGITISFDFRGRELFRSEKNATAVFSVPLDLTTRDTIYVRYGDYFPAFWAVFLLFSIPILLIRRTI